MRSLLILCAITVCLAGPAIAQQGPDFSTPPTWSAGDTWTFRVFAGRQVTYTVLAPSETGYTVKFNSANGDSSLVQYDKNLLPPASFQNFNFIWHPQWPLTSDAKPWSFTNSGLSSAGRASTWNTTEQVDKQEPVTIPAGTFQAVHIKGHQCNQAGGCGDFDIWYAPQVKFFAKIVWANSRYWNGGGVQELASYQLH
jgi:hypothetical protein